MYWYNQMYQIFEPNQYVLCTMQEEKNINASSLSNLNALLYGCHSYAKGQIIPYVVP